MTNFNESKLSKILARRVIAPEDRAQLLPLSTPIYCPTYNGVRAARVTIINPQVNSFFTDDSVANTVMIGSQYKQVAAVAPTQITAVGTPVIDANGIYTGSDTNYYQFVTNQGATLIYKNVTLNDKLFTSNYSGASQEYKSPYTCNELQITVNTNCAVTAKNIDTGETTDLSVTQNATATVHLTGAVELDLTQSVVAGKSMLGTPAHLEAITNPYNVDNTVDIELTKTLNLKYFVPHEVDLETDVNLMDIIKADFAAKFKHAVSTYIVTYIADLITANRVTTVTHGETLAETIGKVLADYIHNGTGQKFSIYKYDNGAPIEYIKNSAQPNIDHIVKEDNVFERYVGKDDQNIPGLYYFENPTLILPEATLEDYETGLVNGTIKDYVEQKLNVDSAEIGFTQIGEGIFGTNDCFAVAFTEPAVKVTDSTDFFGKEICITVNYGVVPINQTNLRVIV